MYLKLFEFYILSVLLLNFSRTVLTNDYNGILQNSSNESSININYEYLGENCYRKCEFGKPRICYFKFILEYYQTMGVACGNCKKGVIEDCFHPQCILVDGIEKGVLSINRQITGPSIHVCKNDTIVVDIVNQASGTAASMHWHGLHMRDTPYMDGVPFLTQCPISFSTAFRYAFKATEAGTHFYHSHSGHQKMSGQYGGLVIREPTDVDPNAAYYDFDLKEHLIVISDWMHSYPEMFFPGLPTRRGGINPDSILINGRGQWIDPQTAIRTDVPLMRFHVSSGYRYRFRIVNSGGLGCPIQLQIENHNFTVIASDSFNIKPKTYSTLTTNSGERYDIVIDANQTPGNYLIRARAIGYCAIESFAILSYNGSDFGDVPILPSYDHVFPTGKQLNHPSAKCVDRVFEDSDCITELSATENDDDLRYGQPDLKFYLGYHLNKWNNSVLFNPSSEHIHFANTFSNLTLTAIINNITMTNPSYPPLTQPENIDETEFCNELNIPEKCKNLEICPCIHRIKIKLNSTVELIIFDQIPRPNLAHHPFHIHGYKFLVMGMGQNPTDLPMNVERAKILDSNNVLKRHSNLNLPYKDTISIPSKGYVIVRFRADNPGFWLLHCHNEWHIAIGMGLVLQVGEIDEMIKPPNDFPKCNNYLPQI